MTARRIPNAYCTADLDHMCICVAVYVCMSFNSFMGRGKRTLETEYNNSAAAVGLEERGPMPNIVYRGSKGAIGSFTSQKFSASRTPPIKPRSVSTIAVSFSNWFIQ